MDRRTFLQRSGATVAFVTVAGCGGDGDGGDGGDPTPTEDSPETTTSSKTRIEVGADDSLVFDPEEVTVSVGETVQWVWRSDGHNIKIDEKPSGSEWSGTPGNSANTFSRLHTHEHTFEVAGTYDYYCSPHYGLGMTGTVIVEE